MGRYRKKVVSEPLNEEQLQTAIWAMIIRKWPTAWVFHPVGGPYQKPGIPDLLICIEGLLIGMEIKHPKVTESVEHARQRATPQQRKEIRAINSAEGMAGVVTSVAEAEDLINRAFYKRDVSLREKGWIDG